MTNSFVCFGFGFSDGWSETVCTMILHRLLLFLGVLFRCTVVTSHARQKPRGVYNNDCINTFQERGGLSTDELVIQSVPIFNQYTCLGVVVKAKHLSVIHQCRGK